MANPRGAGAPRGRGRGRGRRPRMNPVVNPEQPVQEPTLQIAFQEALTVIRNQGEMIEELRAERQAERQARHEEEERRAEEGRNNEEEDELRNEHDEEEEESDRSQSPPRRERVVQTTQNWVTQFCKLKAPAFHGKNDLAEDWLLSLEKIFEVMECPDNRKAQLAIYKLEGDAHRWWKSVSTTLEGTVTWETFLEQFNEQYFPPSVQVIKEEEFLQIQQGNDESFDDYFARFTNLSRYSSYLQIHKNESWKANRLVTGLKYDIRARLVSQQFRKMARAVESCRMTERNLKELRKSRNHNDSRADHSEGSRGNSSRKREAPWSDTQKESKRPFQTGQQSNSRMLETRPCPDCGKYHPGECFNKRVCFGCRKPGHVITNCPEKDVERRVCYRCQKPGHIAPNCPEKAAGFRPQNPGRMYALNDTMDRELPERVQGTISLSKEFSLCINYVLVIQLNRMIREPFS